MEETPRDPGPLEPGPSRASWWPSGFMEKVQTMSLVSEAESLSIREPVHKAEQNDSSQTASEILWATGSFSGTIPNGFYSVIPVSSSFITFLGNVTIITSSFVDGSF